MANTKELDYSRKVADGERLELIMRQVASRFKLDGNVLAEALLDIHERLKAVEGATEELTSSDRWKAFKTVQLVKTSPSASGDTVTAIDTVAQDENGELTATKKNIRQGTTSQTGIVQLSDATNSTSTALAATANAVKTAYDLANTKQDALPTSGTATNTYAINISGNAATATTATSATTASATSSGAIQGGDDLNSYNVANRTYLCSSANATTVSNKPSGASGAFELEVIRGTGSTCVQVYYSRDDASFNYIRKYTGSNTWTAWDRVSLVSDASFSAVNKSENTTDGCTLIFTAIDGSTKRVTVRSVVNAGNADTVDGYHIVVGSTGTNSNTIYFT